MKFIEHSNLSGKHALFSASSWRWINDDHDGIQIRYINAYVKEVGTIIHDFARKHIQYFIKMTKSDKKNLKLELLDKGIPPSVVDSIDLVSITETVISYVNDAIGFRMSPEVVLYYSPLFFGTADTISYSEKEKTLRIHDLKTGKITGHIEQLLIYAALFCLEYNFKPNDINIELRIYQNCEVNVVLPDPNDINQIITKIVENDKYLSGLEDWHGK